MLLVFLFVCFFCFFCTLWVEYFSTYRFLCRVPIEIYDAYTFYGEPVNVTEEPVIYSLDCRGNENNLTLCRLNHGNQFQKYNCGNQFRGWHKDDVAVDCLPCKYILCLSVCILESLRVYPSGFYSHSHSDPSKFPLNFILRNLNSYWRFVKIPCLSTCHSR